MIGREILPGISLPVLIIWSELKKGRLDASISSARASVLVWISRSDSDRCFSVIPIQNPMADVIRILNPLRL